LLPWEKGGGGKIAGLSYLRPFPREWKKERKPILLPSIRKKREETATNLIEGRGGKDSQPIHQRGKRPIKFHPLRGKKRKGGHISPQGRGEQPGKDSISIIFGGGGGGGISRGNQETKFPYVSFRRKETSFYFSPLEGGGANRTRGR